MESYDQLPAAPSAHSHHVSKSRKRKSDGGDVDPEKVKRLRAAVDFVIDQREKRTEQIYEAIKSRVKFAINSRQDAKISDIAVGINRELQRQFGADQRRCMDRHRYNCLLNWLDT